jgi:hypothetical protein
LLPAYSVSAKVTQHAEGGPYDRWSLRVKADIRIAQSHVRFTPEVGA